MGTLGKDLCKFLVISRSVFLRMANVSDKAEEKNKNTNFVFSKGFSNVVPFCDIWKNTFEPCRSHDSMAHALYVLDT